MLAAPAGLVNEVYVSGLTQPTQIVPLPDGRMFIVHRLGTILVLPAGSTTPLDEPLLRITNLYTEHEAGVLGSALAPDFQATGHYYVYYTSADPQRARLSRFTVQGNAASLSSETIIWQDTQTAQEAHHGGTLFFGNDGKIYLATGDNFTPPDSQNLHSARGKLLRFNPDGSIPPDNPFHDGAGPNKDEIWAYGLRNPFRGCIDRETGRIFLGDVGGNDQATAVEEVHIIRRGANYGWPVCESDCGPEIAKPLYSYRHDGVSAAVIGGFVYRGSHFPSEYAGSFFFGDYSHRTIKRLTVDDAGNLVNVFNFEPADGAWWGPYGDITDLAVGADGMIYYLDFGGGSPGNAKIRRIRSTANQAPVIVVQASPTSGQPPLTVSFSSAGSSDPEGAPLTYHWDFGDGATSSQADPSHVYEAPGVFIARLTLSDGQSSVISEEIKISVGRPPVANITNPAAGALFVAGDTIAFAGTATDGTGAALPASACEWTVNFRHENHVHPVISGLKGATSGEFVIERTGHDYGGNTSYEIELTVTDSSGLQDSHTISVFPKKVDMHFTTVPPGLALTVNGLTRPTPFTFDSLIGFENEVEAAPQAKDGQSYHFTSWDHGRPARHTITAPSTEQTYTARFEARDLVLSIPFDEGSGTTAADSVSGASSATLINGPLWTSGKVGAGAVSLDGQNDYVRVDASPALNAARGAITVCAWVYRGAQGPGWHCILSRQKGTTNDEDFGLYFYDDQCSFIVNTDQGDATPSGGIAPVGQWVHLAGTYDGAHVRAYLNGVEQFASPFGGTIASSTNPVIIGGNINDASDIPAELFMGHVDDVRIYDRALSPTEIAALLNPAVDPEPPPPPPPPADQTGPVISAVAASDIGTASARISWITDEASDTQVEYGLTASYGSTTPLDPALVTVHSAVLSGLFPLSTYHYRVLSRDTAGNVSTSTGFTFTTLPETPVVPPVTPNTPPPSVSISTALVNGRVQVSLTAPAGFQWQVQSKERLSDPTWKPIGDSFPGAGSIARVEDSQRLGAQRFYRAMGTPLNP